MPAQGAESRGRGAGDIMTAHGTIPDGRACHAERASLSDKNRWKSRSCRQVQKSHEGVRVRACGRRLAIRNIIHANTLMGRQARAGQQLAGTDAAVLRRRERHGQGTCWARRHSTKRVPGTATRTFITAIAVATWRRTCSNHGNSAARKGPSRARPRSQQDCRNRRNGGRHIDGWTKSAASRCDAVKFAARAAGDQYAVGGRRNVADQRSGSFLNPSRSAWN